MFGNVRKGIYFRGLKLKKMKKSIKQDPKLVAAKQKYEISYISKRFKIPVKIVRAVAKEIGRSRVKVYARLRELGFTLGKK